MTQSVIAFVLWSGLVTVIVLVKGILLLTFFKDRMVSGLYSFPPLVELIPTSGCPWPIAGCSVHTNHTLQLFLVFSRLPLPVM